MTPEVQHDMDITIVMKDKVTGDTVTYWFPKVENFRRLTAGTDEMESLDDLRPSRTFIDVGMRFRAVQSDETGEIYRVTKES